MVDLHKIKEILQTCEGEGGRSSRAVGLCGNGGNEQSLARLGHGTVNVEQLLGIADCRARIQNDINRFKDLLVTLRQNAVVLDRHGEFLLAKPENQSGTDMLDAHGVGRADGDAIVDVWNRSEIGGGKDQGERGDKFLARHFCVGEECVDSRKGI